jgi:hypothetical protein
MPVALQQDYFLLMAAQTHACPVTPLPFVGPDY